MTLPDRLGPLSPSSAADDNESPERGVTPSASHEGIAVVVPVHNAENFLDETLQSIVDQECPPQRIIVVDDGSRDASTAVVRRWAQKYASIELISIETARGPSAARNLGWRASRCDWIAFVDADDVWHSSHLRKLAAAARRHPDAAVIASDTVLFGGPLTASNAFGTVDRDPPDPLVIEEPAFGLFSSTINVTQSATLVRRACLEQVGGYDESRRYAEDLDLWFRLADVGKFVFMPSATLAYRQHAGQTSTRKASQMFHAGWEIRRSIQGKVDVAETNRAMKWRLAERTLLENDLRSAWYSGQRDALNTMIEIAGNGSTGSDLVRYWKLRRAMLWHLFLTLRRVKRAWTSLK